MEFKDYYATLGVPKTASDADIKKAFRKLARENHPDLNAGNKAAEARFKEINEANEVLSNPETRRKYDDLGSNWRAYEQAERNAGANGGSWAGPFAQGTGGYRTVTPEEMHEMFGDDDPFSDFFHRFFSGGAAAGAAGSRRGRPAPPRRGADFESEVDLTLEEVFQGATRRLRLDAPGSQARTVEVRIPPGVPDGARVRVAGEGEAAPKGGSSGDLFLRVRIQPHPRFEREGADLRTHVAVPVTVAVLGGEVPVTTLSGSTLRLKIPALTPSGRRLRIRGQGMPTVGGKGGRGDLYATIDIAMPSSLSDEARAHYEALRKLEQS